MKTKLFSFLTAMFFFSVAGFAQYPVITLIGSGNGGWTDTAETTMITSNGTNYSLVDKILTDGEVKFREGKCWTTGCPATVGNKFGWGPTDAQHAIDGGWPSGTNNSPQDNGKNIACKAGVWTIEFNRLTGAWSFVPGTPLPVIKLVGTAVSTVGGVTLTADLSGTMFEAKKVRLQPGNCQFMIDSALAGAVTFPTGDAVEGTTMIPVTTTGIDYDVTFDFTLYKYVFKVATFPVVSIVGDAVGGWPTDGVTDKNLMTTTDGVTYTFKNLPVVAGKALFRVNNGWDTKYGAAAFPAGSGNGGSDISVPAEAVGNYNVTLNTTTKAYTFTKNTYSIVGTGVGGWPSDFPGRLIDEHQLMTTDGINYKKAGLVVAGGGVKFRANNDWSDNWGGNTFPAGTKTGNDFIAVAGTYNLTVNVLTGAYDFGANLGLSKYEISNFKAYPNPATNNWKLSAGSLDIKSVKVYDVAGKVVSSKNTAAKEVNVNAAELAKGVYFAKIATEKGTTTVKLVKE